MVDDRNIDQESEEWTQARNRLKGRRDFTSNLYSFLLLSVFFIVIWAVSGAGYFWPAWIIGPWGIGLLLHAWQAFGRRPVTDADIEAEVRRRRG